MALYAATLRMQCHFELAPASTCARTFSSTALHSAFGPASCSALLDNRNRMSPEDGAGRMRRHNLYARLLRHWRYASPPDQGTTPLRASRLGATAPPELTRRSDSADRVRQDRETQQSTHSLHCGVSRDHN